MASEGAMGKSMGAHAASAKAGCRERSVRDQLVGEERDEQMTLARGVRPYSVTFS